MLSDLHILVGVVAWVGCGLTVPQPLAAQSDDARPATGQAFKPGLRYLVRPEIPPVPTAGTIPSRQLSASDVQSEFPDITTARDGTHIAVWVEDHRGRERVVACRIEPDGAPGPAQTVHDELPAYHRPRIVRQWQNISNPVHNARYMVVFAGRAQENWDIYATTLDTQLHLITTERVTDDPAPDIEPSATIIGPPTKDGDSEQEIIQLTWQSFRNGVSGIYVRELKNGLNDWSDVECISDSHANAWSPTITSYGGLYANAWDTYSAGNYDVMLRTGWRGQQEIPIQITDSPQAEFHASVAIGRGGRVWVAYDVDSINWGKDFAPGSGTAAVGSRGLHAKRTVDVRVYHDGKVHRSEPGIDTLHVGGLAMFSELPHLVVDGKGNLWMIVRHWKLRKPTEVYVLYASRLTRDGWSKPYLLENSEGRNSQRVGTTVGEDGRVRVVYAGDGRGRNRPFGYNPAMPYTVQYAVLPESDPADDASKIPLIEVEVKDRPAVPPKPTRWKVTAGGQEYTLIAGDLHRHTDIRGHGAVDASILDTYRYAIDAAQLDFMGITDHNQVDGGTWVDGLRDYQWSFSQKAADWYHYPPTFIAMYAYEHSLRTPSGHRNLIFAERGGKMRPAYRSGIPEDNQPPNLWAWVTRNRQRVAIIPHTIAEGAEGSARWNSEPPAFEPVLEIYQGARSSYEAAATPVGLRRGNSATTKGPYFAKDALDRGFHYGFISSSDHASTHNSYAYLYVKGLDRESVLEALWARRTYAASDNILIDATMNGHMIGEAFTLRGDKPKLKVRLSANNDILRIDVIRQGKVVYTREPNDRSDQFEWVDPEPRADKSTYYYLRIIQRDVEVPKGDPEMAWVSPFFVTYQGS